MLGRTDTRLPASIFGSCVLENFDTPVDPRYSCQILLSNDGRSSTGMLLRPPCMLSEKITWSFLYSVGRAITFRPFARVHTVEPWIPAFSFTTGHPASSSLISDSATASSTFAWISAFFAASSTPMSSSSVGFTRPSFSGPV